MTESKSVVDLLLEDHEEIKGLLGTLGAAGTASGPTKKEAFENLVWELVKHETAEEEVVYPALRQLDGGDAIADARIKEENKANKVLAELEKLDITSTEWDSKFSCLKSDVPAHASAEEKEVFPLLRKHQDGDHLVKMGKVLELAKKAAPTHPHPKVPGTATANLIAGPLAAVVDRARDAIKDAREALAS